MRPWKEKEHPGPDDTVACPKCGARVGTEVLRGRVRWVTTTVVHIKAGSPSTVCHAILKTEEHRDRTA